MANKWEQMLKEKQVGCNSIAAALKKNSQRFQRSHYTIGIPTTAFTVLAGATLVAAIDVDGLRIAMGIIALIASVLTGLMTFINYGQRAEEAMKFSVRYSGISKRIEELLLYVPETEEDQQAAFIKINNSLIEVEEEMKPYLTVGIENSYRSLGDRSFLS